jgi:chemotaxis protein CheD
MTPAVAPAGTTDRRHADTDLSPGAGERRFYDPRYGLAAVRVAPGGCYATQARAEMIVTVLGSCVAACVRNPHTGYGGMNHFMLPESASGDWNGASASMRYGNHAMEALINEVLKSGCARHELEIKLFGGAHFGGGWSTVGEKNADFALRYLETDGLRVAAADLGGPYGRRIHYFPATGDVKRLLLRRASDMVIVEEENRYRSSLAGVSVEGSIDLFG